MGHVDDPFAQARAHADLEISWMIRSGRNWSAARLARRAGDAGVRGRHVTLVAREGRDGESGIGTMERSIAPDRLA